MQSENIRVKRRVNEYLSSTWLNIPNNRIIIVSDGIAT